jgi:hypothetical protein
MLPPRALPPAQFERNEGTSYFVTWTLPQHRLIAKKLRENPEAVLGLARRNLRRYIGRRRPAPATSLWREWLSLLEQNSIDRIVAVITAKTDKAAELRQASPFAGALTQEEIDGTIQREKERARVRC